MVGQNSTEKGALQKRGYGRRYALYFLIIPLLGYFFPLVAERFPPLDYMAVTYLGQMLDYGYHLDNTNADVVIFGDSTADFNEDIVKLSKRCNLRIVNIPNDKGSLSVLESAQLRRYLAHNSPPKLIIFHFAAWELDITGHPNSTYDGFEQIFRHGSLREVIAMTERRPLGMIFFPLHFYSSSSRLTSFEAWKKPPLVTIAGHTDYPESAALRSDCVLPKAIATQHDTATVQRLVRQFGGGQTKVAVYIAPVPACVNAAEVVAQPRPGLVAAPPATLPADQFAADGYYCHMLAGRTAEATALLEEFIRKQL